MLTEQKMIEVSPGKFTRSREAPTEQSIYLQIVLEGLREARNHSDSHCATVARLYHDRQITTYERDLLLLYLQVRTSATPASVKREYLKCMAEYMELLNPKPEEKEG